MDDRFYLFLYWGTRCNLNKIVLRTLSKISNTYRHVYNLRKKIPRHGGIFFYTLSYNFLSW